MTLNLIQVNSLDNAILKLNGMHTLLSIHVIAKTLKKKTGCQVCREAIIICLYAKYFVEVSKHFTSGAFPSMCLVDKTMHLVDRRRDIAWADCTGTGVNGDDKHYQSQRQKHDFTKLVGLRLIPYYPHT